MLKNIKGYLLIETLLISVMVAGMLVYLYAQFSTINNAYNDLYKYNTVNELYITGVIKDLVRHEATANSSLRNGSVITVCKNNAQQFTFTDSHTNYSIKEICAKTDVKNVFLVRADQHEKLATVVSGSEYSDLIRNFVKSFENKGSSKYRIVVEFAKDKINGRAATLIFEG